jgi:hypothetical protein
VEKASVDNPLLDAAFSLSSLLTLFSLLVVGAFGIVSEQLDRNDRGCSLVVLRANEILSGLRSGGRG